jgi:uncharacterized peroxidase-related enzyme
MPHIKVIGPEHASGRLLKIYQRISDPGGQVDNVLQIHSLRPHSLEGHMALYKAVLHHPRNTLPTWFLESIGVLVSLLNQCGYCARHHSAGLKGLLQDASYSYEDYREQLDSEFPGEPFTAAEQTALAYARTLTLDPGGVGPAHIDAMKAVGLKDGQILEINQVSAYFAYANRTVTGLGVDTAGEVLGLSPGDSEDWQHT